MQTLQTPALTYDELVLQGLAKVRDQALQPILIIIIDLFFIDMSGVDREAERVGWRPSAKNCAPRGQP